MKTMSFLALIFTSCFVASPDVPEPGEKLLQLWSVDHGTAGGASPILYADKIIMSGGLFVYALEEETGEELWSYQFEDDNVLQGRIFLINGNQVTVAHTDKIRAWDITGGTLDWEFDYITSGLEPRLTGKHVSYNDGYGFTSEQSLFFTLDKNGAIDFIKSLDSSFDVQGLAYYSNALFVGQKQTVHGGLTLGRITALNAQTEDSLWVFNTEDGGFTRAAPIVEQGVLYAGTSGNSPKSLVVALQTQTGSVVWEYITSEPLEFTRSLLLSPDHVLFSASGRLVALHKETGEKAWEFDWTNSTLVKPVYLEGYVYHSDHNRLFVIDQQTGQLVHEEPLPENGGFFWHLAVSEDKLFAQTSTQLIAYQPWHLRE